MAKRSMVLYDDWLDMMNIVPCLSCMFAHVFVPSTTDSSSDSGDTESKSSPSVGTKRKKIDPNKKLRSYLLPYRTEYAGQLLHALDDFRDEHIVKSDAIPQSILHAMETKVKTPILKRKVMKMPRLIGEMERMQKTIRGAGRRAWRQSEAFQKCSYMCMCIYDVVVLMSISMLFSISMVMLFFLSMVDDMSGAGEKVSSRPVPSDWLIIQNLAFIGSSYLAERKLECKSDGRVGITIEQLSSLKAANLESSLVDGTVKSSVSTNATISTVITTPVPVPSSGSSISAVIVPADNAVTSSEDEEEEEEEQGDDDDEQAMEGDVGEQEEANKQSLDGQPISSPIASATA